jgi:hypothetical protein
MEIFIDDDGNEAQVGFDGKPEAERVQQAKAELITEQFGEPQPLILGKFTSQDALATSYKELESEAGRLRAELAALKSAPPAPAASAEGSTATDPPPAAPSTPSDPPPAAAPADPVPTVTPEQQQRVISSVLAQAGGEEEFGKLADWATKNIEPARVQAFNDALSKGDEQLVLTSLRAIQYDRLMRNGYEPPLLGGQPGGSSLKPFTSEQQVSAAMSDPRYSGIDADPAYVDEVMQRMAMSPNIFQGR